MKMCSTDNKTTKPEQKVFYGSGSRKKIGQTYFKLCQTYFKIGQTYFSALLTGVTASKASGFLRSYAALKHTLVCCGCMALLVGASAMLALASCSDSEHTESAPRENVKLLVSIPGYTATGGKEDKSTGDPGTAVDEGSDWDRLTIILAYNDNGNRVLKRTLSKDDFDNLPDYESRPGIKLFTINVPVGNTYIYGITYSSNAANNPEADIEACKSYTDVQELTISNDYASNNSTIDYAKFVSVATGYYAGDDGQPALFNVQQGSGEIGSMPTMTLTRLASKIDVQWDAADAYEQGYTEVKITDFKYNGQAVGRMFPSVKTVTVDTEKAWTFYNTSDISQRNGRVYHYTFTDGTYKPSITFHIDAKNNGVAIPDEGKDFTLNFKDPLRQAAWYKVNATIKGITGSGSINLAM